MGLKSKMVVIDFRDGVMGSGASRGGDGGLVWEESADSAVASMFEEGGW